MAGYILIRTSFICNYLTQSLDRTHENSFRARTSFDLYILNLYVARFVF